MTDVLRVLLEIGKSRRVVAAAAEWPGLDRWGTTEDAAVAKLLAYLPRYAPVAVRAGMEDAFARASRVEIVERTPGSSSTDFWGIAHVPSAWEAGPMDAAGLERRLTLLTACWTTFDAIEAAAPEVLRPAGRTEGRPRELFLRHVLGSELHNFAPKVEVREQLADLMGPATIAAYRARFLDAIRTYHATGRTARRWPLAFLIRRTAQHSMDHAWELEDRTTR